MEPDVQDVKTYEFLSGGNYRYQVATDFQVDSQGVLRFFNNNELVAAYPHDRWMNVRLMEPGESRKERSTVVIA